MTTLLFTQHGSHLYGLATPKSDMDTYRVVADGRRAKQKIQGDLDTMEVPLSDFLRQCDLGVPQALEAMFSHLAEPGPLDAYRASYRVDLAQMRPRYLRTVKNFVRDARYDVDEYRAFKRRRHGIRLLFNLAEAMSTGRFHPGLTQQQKDFATEHATDESLVELINLISPVEISWYRALLTSG